MPYLYQAAIQTHETGLPVMRAMVLEYEKDRMCRYLDKQYMLGDSLLVAPVMNPDSMGEYYLPERTWTNFFTQEQREGGRWYEEPCGYLEIPLWVRPNTVLALGSRADTPEYAYEEGTVFRIYALTAQRDGNRIRITSEGTGTYTVELIRIKATAVAGAAYQVLENRTVLDGCGGSVSVTL